MKKQLTYENLVIKRKSCKICKDLANPSRINGGQFDSNHIGPWSIWQGNLNADILIVGQDWGDINYFTKWKGKDKPAKNPTNENLQGLLKSIGINIKTPGEKQDQIVFLTNLILCLKTGGLQAPVEDEWSTNCSIHFFKPLVDIIKPRVIIPLGKKTTEVIFNLYSYQIKKSLPYKNMVINAPYNFTKSLTVFPVYHCGAGSVNRNRSLSEQYRDWEKIGKWLKTH